MADTTSKHKLVIDDNGTLKSLINAAKQLNKELEKTQGLSGGSRTPKAVAAAQAAAGRESGLARSVGKDSGTGSASRDFAKQAEGLGGLVRLYATFAANVFAATAALTALSRAMDTTNMIKGLDQLGAASGRSLGSLAQKLALATDGAVSLREAMEATAKASAAGLTNKQILQLGDVAKKASQALGVNMVDSLSRLTRGISKLEPELLDELGIFVRIDKAAENYARTLGKTASSLTDFERRQAFAVAVLEQGNEKFAAINIDANPYTKLYATFINVTQAGLELVNKVLSPIVKLLAESPTALAAVITGIAFMLLRQALPALSSWRTGLANAAKESAEHAKKFRDSLPDKWLGSVQNIFDIPKLQKELSNVEKQILNTRANIGAKATAVNPDLIAKYSRLQNLAGKSEEEQQKAIKGVLDIKQKRAAQIAADATKYSAKEIAQNDIYLKNLKSINTELENQIRLRSLAAQKASIEQRIREARDKGVEAAGRGPESMFATGPVATRRAENLRKTASATAAVSAAAESANILGIKLAWQQLNKTVTEEGITGLQKYYTLAKGGAASVISRIMGIASAFSNVFMIVGVATVAFQLLDSIFSNNSKQSAEFASAIDSANESMKNMDRTIEAINRKPFAEQLSSDSIKARATALGELVEGMQSLLDTTNAKLAVSGGFWDSSIEWLKSFAGSDTKTQAATKFFEYIESSLKGAGNNADKLVQSINAVTGIDIRNKGSIAKLIADDPDAFNALLPSIIAKIKELSKAQQELSNKTDQAKNSFQAANKAFDDFIVSSLPTDPVAKLGSQFIKTSIDMSASMNTMEDSMAVVLDIANNLATTRFFSPEIREIFIANAESIKSAAATQSAWASSIQSSEKALKELNAQLDAANKLKKAANGNFVDPKYIEDINARIAAFEKVLAQGKQEERKAKAELETYVGMAREATKTAFIEGARLLETSIGLGFQKALTTLRGFFASGPGSDTQAGVEESYKLKLAEISLQAATIKTQIGLIESNEQLRATIEINNLLVKLRDEKDETKQAELRALINAIDKGRSKYKDFGSVRADLQSGDLPTRQAAQAAYGAASSATTLRGNLANLNIEKIIAGFQKIAKAQGVTIANEKTTLDLQLARVKNQLVYSNSLANNLPYLSQFQLYERERNVTMEGRLNLAKEVLDIEKDRILVERNIAELTENKNNLPRDYIAKQVEAQEAVLRELYARETQAKDRQTELQKQLRVDLAVFEIENIDKEFNYRLGLADAERNREFSYISEKIEKEKQAIEFLAQYKLISESDKIMALAELDKEAERNRLQQRLSALNTANAREQMDIQKRISLVTELANITGTDVDTEALAQLTRELAISAQKYQSLAKLEEDITKRKIDQIDKATKFNTLLEITKELGIGLSEVFGEVGKNIIGVADAILVAIDRQEKFNDEVKSIDTKIGETTDAKEREKLEAQKGKLVKQNAKTEMDSNIAIINSTKKLFKEKTTAYKILNAMEKAMHLYRMAITIKEIVMGKVATASSLQDNSTKMAGDVAEAGVKGVKAVINTLSSLPAPANFVAGAAMAALVASLLSKIGGKAPAMPGGFDAESQQKVQGTGQAYVDGKLVNRGGGALGDPTEKADSLAKGIDLIEEHTFSNLEYANQMLDSLKAIRKNTSSLGALIAQAGLNYKGLNVSTGSWSTTTLAEPAIKSLGSLIFGENSGIGKLATKAWNSVFGGKVTTELLDVGIKIAGKFDGVINNTEDLVKVYESLKVTKDGGWFKSDKTSFDTKQTPIDELGKAGMPEMSEIFEGIFREMGNVIKSGLDTLLIGIPDVLKERLNILENFDVDFKASLKDLKGEDLTKALESELSVTFNKITEAVFPELEEFRNLGEEMGETLIRVSRASQVVDLSLESIGMKFKKSSDWVNNIRITDNLIEKFGDLDTFVSKTNFFRDNFLTEAERIAPVQAAVTKEMNRLGLSSVDTIEEFKNTVLALDLTDEKSQELYKSLMNVAEGFNEVYKETAKVARKPSEIAKDRIKQEVEILLLQGKAQESVNLQRWEEYKLLEEELKPGQQKIWNLQDTISAMKEENSILSALGYTYENTVRTRHLELNALNEVDKALRMVQYTLLDQLNTQKLLIDLMEAEGDAVGALAARRKLELRALSAGDQLIKIRIWQLQEQSKLESANADQRVKILQLLNKNEEALRITRAKELKDMDEQLRPAQEYIYALEDQASLISELKTAYDKQNTSIKNVISSLKQSLQALKDYKDNLLQSDLSILDPTQKYNAAKQKALQLEAIARGPAVTDEQIEARDKALSDLPGAMDKWLEASRTLYASSGTYVSDFNMVTNILDSLGTSLGKQLTDAEKQLNILEDNKEILDLIKDNTRSTTEILSDIKNLQTRLVDAQTRYENSPSATGNVSAGIVGPKVTAGASGIFGADDSTLIGSAGLQTTLGGLKERIKADLIAGNDRSIYSLVTSNGITSQMIDSLLGLRPGTALEWAIRKGLPAFAQGGLARGASIVGERGWEVADFQNPTRVYNNQDTMLMFGNVTKLSAELALIRDQLIKLREEQHEQTGHLISTNLEAANKTADAIVTAANDSVNATNWENRNAPKLA